MKNNPFQKIQARNAIFHLSGGIGNQLFVYAAGKAYSRAFDKPVKFDVSNVGKGFTNHRSSIQTLLLDLEIAANQTSFQKFQRRVFNRCDRIIHGFTRKQLPSLFNYYSHEIGFDEALLKKKHKVNFYGYFQSWRYVERIFDLFPPSNEILNQPSKWFQDMSSLANLTEPIIIHVRRGDYKKLSDSYGLLSKEYYSAALCIARDYLPNNPIWIFSDDPEEARNLLQSTLPIDTHWINPPIGTDPVESLILMTFGAANIIGNSTYSWWGAILNRHSKITVAPEKWFKGMADPKDLYPPSWRFAPSFWEN